MAWPQQFGAIAAETEGNILIEEDDKKTST